MSIKVESLGVSNLDGAADSVKIPRLVALPKSRQPRARNLAGVGVYAISKGPQGAEVDGRIVGCFIQTPISGWVVSGDEGFIGGGPVGVGAICEVSLYLCSGKGAGINRNFVNSAGEGIFVAEVIQRGIGITSDGEVAVGLGGVCSDRGAGGGDDDSILIEGRGASGGIIDSYNVLPLSDDIRSASEIEDPRPPRSIEESPVPADA